MGLPTKRKQEGGTATQKPKKKKIIILVIVVVVLVLIALMASRFAPGAGHRQDESLYTEEVVQKRDITTELSYSGTLEPADSYVVTSLVGGEILTADFEEGDIVSEDDVLYIVDSSDAATGVERAENSLEQAQRSYEQAQKSLADLNVKAPAAGRVIDLQVELGDEVSMGQIVAVVRDSDTMSIELPFPADEAAGFYIGQAAQVVVDGSFETINGTVTGINASDTVLTGNRIVRMVTIQVANPGAMTSSTMATATVGTSACAESGTFTYKAEKNVTADVSGDVVSLPVAEGAQVSEGQTIVVLSSDTIENQVANAADQVEDAQLSLDNQKDTLDNYAIESPIDGTIIDKTYKAGDNLEAGKQLCTIFDLNYLTFTMYVDELDISQVQVGQTVQITADALEGQTFEGKITKVSINGTTTGGVTSYPVTVRIDETNGLLPGMNVDASVIVAESRGVLSVPVEAVSRGNRILVKTDGPNAAQEGNEEGLPVGYEYVEVELGESNDDYIEVLSGLEDGDQIAYIKASTAGVNLMEFAMGGMSADSMPAGMPGMPAGGMPSGGPGGGF